MNIISLVHDGDVIELLVNDGFDLSLVTANAQKLFELKGLMQEAMTNLFCDYSKEIDTYKDMTTDLRAAGALGYPLDARDPRLYAIDTGIAIESELTLEV
jgi:hypothetical protein